MVYSENTEYVETPQVENTLGIGLQLSCVRAGAVPCCSTSKAPKGPKMQNYTAAAMTARAARARGRPAAAMEFASN